MDPCKTSSLFVFFIFHCLAFVSFSVCGSTREFADRDSLLAFRSEIINDPLGIFNSWNASADFCNWPGVTCSSRHHGRVTGLDLQSQQLEGTLSPHIGNLSFLKTLNLQNNSFTFKIPEELGALHRLQFLQLDNNSFSGELPTNISRCSNLVFLSLRGNDLGGQLPSELGVLSKLQTFDLLQNNFVGNIPLSFGNLSSLLRIRLTSNSLQGNIPSTFGQLKNVGQLLLGANKLSGPIPSSIFNLSSLTVLSLPINELNGSLPHDIGPTLPKLEYIVLYTNQFSGAIPATIANLTFLHSFDIATNRLTGKVPHLGSLHELNFLNFAENELGSGDNDDLNFMSSLLNSTTLEFLGLSDNKLGGMMPSFLSNFSTEIKQLAFGRNQIQGTMPSEIGNLINLEVLGMETNLLTGRIPNSIGKLKNLYKLFLGGNKLSGEIPYSIGNLTLLGYLVLATGNLNGSIPPSIGGCISLQGLLLSYNKLSGTIPRELFAITSLSVYLDLSNNNFIGSLPMEVGKLENLNFLDISKNDLSGEIPQTLGRCTTLEGLYMAGNFFYGKIPSSFSFLKALQFLDLSRNNLSGQVPTYLENFALLNLNLSWNDFEGELPHQRLFSNLTAFSVAGNKKLCGGIPELNLPRCIPKKSKPSKLKLIVSAIVVVIGMMLLSCAIFIYILRRKTKDSTESSSSIATSIPTVSYDDLLKATNGFSSSNLIGVGGFGSVYKGVLGPERSMVAVKVLNLAKKGATKSFIAECVALRSIRHRNLVKILTVCSSVDFKGNDFKALVYEFMINNSLEDWLHPIHTNESDEQKYVTFVQRLNIIVDVANALDYMHNECQAPIVHCDIKPSNILIDEDMVARVGDFGLAKLCLESTHQISSTQSTSIGIKGSIGYTAPEYGMGSEVSTYGDVYSFGILLLEIFTGKRPTNSMFKDGLDLHNYAKMALPERVMQIADPIQFQSDHQFVDDKVVECLISVFKLGVACSVESPKVRMKIKNAAEELVRIRDNQLQVKGKNVKIKDLRLITHLQ